MTDRDSQSTLPTSNELIASLRDGDSKFRIAAPRSYDGTLARAADEIERLTRERDTAREALRISEQRVREHWPERERLRTALSHVKGRAKLRDSATLLDIIRLADDALSGEHPPSETSHEYPHAVIELAWRVVNSTRDTCAAANAVLVHRQLIGELREALQAKIPAEKASVDYCTCGEVALAKGQHGRYYCKTCKKELDPGNYL